MRARTLAAWPDPTGRQPVCGNQRTAAGCTAAPAFIGRERALATLEDVWRRASGKGRVFLGGEPGIGKTRLASELARRLHHDGTLVLLGTMPRRPRNPLGSSYG